METLKLGSKGEDVKILQGCLHLLDDGVMGPLTVEVLKQWQSDNGLVPDGVCGKKTWEKLLGLKVAKRPINKIILHCTATQEGVDYSVASIRRDHIRQGWKDIGYHYVIYRDGTVNTGRDVNIVGSHCSGHNTGSIGISYVGGVDKKGKPKDTRTPQQKAALKKLVRSLMNLYGLTLSNVYCHNSFTNAKACPSFSRSAFMKEMQE